MPPTILKAAVRQRPSEAWRIMKTHEKQYARKNFQGIANRAAGARHKNISAAPRFKKLYFFMRAVRSCLYEFNSTVIDSGTAASA